MTVVLSTQRTGLPDGVLEGLEEVAEGVIVRPMLTIDDAIDLWLGHLARIGRAGRTRDSYCRILDKFCDRYPRGWDVARITTEECEAFLDLWANRAENTRYSVYSPINGLFGWLYHTRKIKTNPMEYVDPPTRPRPEDLDTTNVNPLDVPLMLREAKPGTERNALHILAYLGPRRRAVSRLKLADYDQRAGMLRFHEKGRKTIWKPIPSELRQVLDASIAASEIWAPPHDYLIPPKAMPRRKDERDDRVIWRAVKDIAERVGIEAHVHALRAAFACFYLLHNPGDLYGLKELLGHRSVQTTMIYLRRFDKQMAMERVRDLSWGNTTPVADPQIAGNVMESFPYAEKEGFEPSFSEQQPSKRAGTEHAHLSPPEGSG